jgi:serine/threonine protein phosphatase 1
MKPELTDKPTFSPGDFVAVGDVHGCVDLVWNLISKLRDTGVHILFLGDLIDRAQKRGDDVVVLNVVKSLIDDPKSYGLASVDALRGNHEQMFLDAAAAGPFDRDGHVGLWAQNGGAVDSFNEMRPHIEWIRKLPLFKKIDTTLFVHAGLRPYVPMDSQVPSDLIWIRQPFLSRGPVGVPGVDFVVHGHTPDFKNPGRVDIRENRVNLDSGAYYSGLLTGYNHNTREVFQVK